MITIGPGPKNATTDRQGLRTYTWQGRKLPSVTTVRRMAGIPHGLHQWAVGKVIDKAIDTLPEIFARVSTGDPSEIAMVRSALRRASTEERDAAARLGTAVHDAAASGRALTEVDPEVAPRLRQYLDWRAVSRAEILAVEFQVFNLTEGYAGTADLLARFPDGSVWLIDLKTGKGLYGEHSLQLIAYLMAEFVGTDDVIDEDATHLLHQASGLGVLHLAADHWEFRSLRADPDTWTAFRGLLRFATWMHEHEAIDTVTVGARKGGS
jgi:hypothetical protein